MPETTTLDVPISANRLVYIARLWDQNLFLIFDGELLHLKEKTFNWKTGSEVEAVPGTKKMPNPEKVNELTKPDMERVQHLLTQINKEYENDKR